MKTRNLFGAFAIFALVMGTACADNKKNETEKTAQGTEVQEAVKIEEGTPNIIGVAVSNENFTTLVAAVKAASLVETLSGDGPFTVFAPTNDAFAKLPEGTVENLLKPENKATLTAVLTYHVVAGKFMAADVVKAINDNNGSFVIKTVQGNDLTATLSGANVILTDAQGGTSTVVIADVAASNGVIHAIDTVIMP